MQAPSSHLRTWLEKLPAQYEPVVMALRTLIGTTAPDAHEIVYHDTLCYSPTEADFDPIVFIAVFSAHINLGLFYGGFLHDPEGLLLGTGKRMRHVTIRSLQECANPALARLLEQAWMDGPHRVAQRHRA